MGPAPATAYAIKDRDGGATDAREDHQNEIE